MAKVKRERQPWQLTPADFQQPEVYAKHDWRYQMFFEYLRLSPSYAVALSCESLEALERELGDVERAALVWKTKEDMGDVYSTIFKLWWNERGLDAFGVHAQRPTVVTLAHLPPRARNKSIQQRAGESLEKFLSDRFERQGRPDSILFSIPLGQKTSITVRQLKKALTRIRGKYDPIDPPAKYKFVKNKMRMDRAKAGYHLVNYRAAKPDEELWRAATRARISKDHGHLDPNGSKKRAEDGHARRMLTIMASRLYRETLILAENAAIGKFPCLDPIDILKFDLRELGVRMRKTFATEKAIAARMKQEAETQKKAEQGGS